MPVHEKSDYHLDGLNVLITGATQGIGAGISLRLCELGANVMSGYLENDQTAGVLTLQAEGLKGKLSIFKRDTTTVKGAKEFIRAGIKKFKKVDALVSNLGPFLYRSIAETPVKEWDEMIVSNLSSHFYLAREILPHMKKWKKGSLVFIGGVGSGEVTGHPMAGAYNAAKVGLAEFMKTLAGEEAKNGIRSNMVAPGIIDNGEYSDGFRERIVGAIPMGYIGEPEDIAEAVAWLLSPGSSYVTGTVIDVSGGYHLANK